MHRETLGQRGPHIITMTISSSGGIRVMVCNWCSDGDGVGVMW